MLDNFREWLSDNLRYILLGLAILIVLVILFFGIKALTGGFSKEDTQPDKKTEQEIDSEDSEDSADTEKKTQEEKEENYSLEKNAYPEVNTLIQAFYTAWSQKNVDQMKTLTDSFDATDEAKVQNAAYIEEYKNINVYTKSGLTEDSYVVFVEYDLKFAGITTAAPGLAQLYVEKDGSGKYIIHNDENDAEVNEYMEKIKQEEDVKELIREVEDKLNEAIDSDDDLKTFEEELGQEASMSTMADNGSMLTTQDSCNMRAEASTDSEVLDELEAGTQVKKLDNAGDNWIKVEYNGMTGYIYGDLLQ